jgi:hypothetical protein
MKAIYLNTAGALALTFGIAACVPSAPAPMPAPAPAPVQRPAPARPAPVSQAPAYDSWMDAPATPGTWVYSATANGSKADFGTPGTLQGFTFSCRATTAGPQIEFMRYHFAKDFVPFTVRTETATRTFQARVSSQMTILVSGIDPRDPLLDAMALSKGRFAVETDGLPPLYLPSHAEVSRVIEDCR